MSFAAAGVQVASLYAKLGADASDFDREMKRADGVLGKVSGTVGFFAKAGVTTALAGLGALGAGFGVATKQGMEFGKTMSGAGAVLGANAEQMENLSSLALQIGKDTAFGASEAASAIEMLAKNGLNAEQILGGAAEATVALAAATGADLATAADVATDAMAQFGLTTADLQRAINGVSGVVVSSKFDINDYAMALSQGGGVAGKLGVSFEDFNTTIAATASGFGSGSDAGTSFKTFLQRLPGISNPAKEALAKLGILTAEGGNAFFDAAGNMKDMASIAGILQRSLAGLSDATKLELLGDAFGTDAIRTALGLASVGEEGFRALAGQMAGVDASVQASMRMDNLAGDVEELSGSFETLGIKVQRAFDPMQRRAVQFFTQQVNKLIDWDWDAVARQVGKVLDLFMNPAAGRLLDDLVAGVGNFVGLIGRVSGQGAAAFTSLFQQLSALKGQGAGAWLSALADGLEGVGEALWGWVQPQIPLLLGQLDMLWGGLTSWVLDPQKRGELLGKLAGWGGAFWAWAGGLWNEYVQPGLVGLWGDVTSWVTDSQKRQMLLDRLSVWGGVFWAWAGTLWTDRVQPGLVGLWGDLAGWVTEPEKRTELLGKLGEAWTSFADWAGGLWTDVEPRLDSLAKDMDTWLTKNAPSLADWVSNFQGFANDVASNWALRWPEITERLGTAKRNILGDLEEIKDAFFRIFGAGGETETSLGYFVVTSGVAFMDIWTTIAERTMESLKGMVLMVEQVVLAFKALGDLDPGAAWEAAQQAGILFGEAVKSSFWDLPMELFGTLSQWANDMNMNGPADTGGGGGFGDHRSGLVIENIEVKVGEGTDVGQARLLADEIAREIWRSAELAGVRLP